MVIFLTGMGLAALIINFMDVGVVGSLIIMLLPMLLLFPMVTASERAALKSGCVTPASRRYNRRFLGFSFAYVIALFAAIGIHDNAPVTGATLWLLALLPTVPILGMIWSIARLFIEETDEYQRMRMAKASIIATGVLLTVATLWGFLEMFELVPHIWLWAVFPVWAVGLAIGQVVDRIRA
ncbi:MAG: hypothetical protein ABIR63_04705 [Sphingomicrobium sp.]